MLRLFGEMWFCRFCSKIFYMTKSEAVKRDKLCPSCYEHIGNKEVVYERNQRRRV